MRAASRATEKQGVRSKRVIIHKHECTFCLTRSTHRELDGEYAARTDLDYAARTLIEYKVRTAIEYSHEARTFIEYAARAVLNMRLELS